MACWQPRAPCLQAYLTAAQGTEIQLLTPADVPGGNQAQVDAAIFGPKGIKAGFSDRLTPEGAQNLELLLSEARCLATSGCQVVLTACTELPLVLDQAASDGCGLGVTVVDPSTVLADEAVRVALLGRSLPTAEVPVRASL